MYSNRIKSLFDVISSIAAIIVFSPLLVILSAILWKLNNGKILFYQPRVGKNEKIITIIKFRTMNDKTSKDGNLLPDADRLTSVGKFVRKTSLDELPQLVNIIKSNMSLIGPRPLLVRYLPYYTIEQRQRHSVKPGITGLAQIKGRNSLTWEEKFDWDIFYAKNVSFKLDLAILFNTIMKVLRSEGVNAPGQATTTPFKQ